MRAFSVVSLLDPDVVPEKTKIHLATWNGADNPLDVYLRGEFAEWQSWQSKRHFERAYVLSLIALPGHNRWLFIGVYDSRGAVWHEEHQSYRYDLTERPGASELNGRLVMQFERAGRQARLNAETWADQMHLDSILPERVKIAEFPGFKGVHLAKHELDTIVRQGVESWKAALSSVAGVYLIADANTGRLYVGSATGEGGIWQRWAQYAASGHGGNKELVQLLGEAGHERAASFRFSILEIADTHTSQADVLSRESHWKRVLLTREHGHNAN